MVHHTHTTEHQSPHELTRSPQLQLTTVARQQFRLELPSLSKVAVVDEAVAATTRVLHDPIEMVAPVQAVQRDLTVQVVSTELQPPVLQIIIVQHEQQLQLLVQTEQLRQHEVEV